MAMRDPGVRRQPAGAVRRGITPLPDGRRDEPGATRRPDRLFGGAGRCGGDRAADAHRGLHRPLRRGHELGTGGALVRFREHLRDQLHRQVWPPWFREWPSIEREARRLRSWELAVIPGLLETAGVRAGRAARRAARCHRRGGRAAGQRPARAAADPAAAGSADAVGDHGRGGAAAPGWRRRGSCVSNSTISSRPRKARRSRCWSCRPRQVRTSDCPAPFVIAEFPSAPDVVYLDTAAQGQIADHPEIVKACAQVFDTLRAEALPPRASLDLITEVRDTWT